MLRGVSDKFIDIWAGKLNPNEDLIENVLTEKKKAIVVVHHTGLGAEIDKIMKLADSHNPVVVEESVQGLLSHYKFRHLGTFGETGCFSFHETKNMQYVESGKSHFFIIPIISSI